jgi:tetratricopeptide (TPR) repeat protein
MAVAVAALYGLLQFLDYEFFPGVQTSGIDPFVWRQAFGPKVFSTFGNPNFFGNFLVILTPITLALMLKRHSDRPGSVMLFAISSLIVSAFLWHTDQFMRIVHLGTWSSTIFTLVLAAYAFYAMVRFSFLGFLQFLITLCIVVTESKGSWIGYTAGFVAYLMLVLYFFSQFQSERMRRIIRRAAVGTLIFSAISVAIYSHMRMQSIRFRVATWTSTWEMALMHPVWGNGIGSFRIIYPAVRRPQIFHIEGKHNTETDHSENEYWEVLQDEGLVGFGLFLWMIATFSALGLRALSRFTEGLSVRDPVTGRRKTAQDPRAFYMLGVLAAFWGMLMHNFMDVSLRFVSSGIFLWLLAGVIGAMVVHDPMPESDKPLVLTEEEKAKFPAHPQPLLLLGQAACALVFGYLSWIVLRDFNDAQGPFPTALGEQLLWMISWAAVLATMAGFWYGLARVGRSLKHVYGFALLLLVMAWPLKTFWGYFMADVFHNRGIFYSKQAKWEDAIASYRKVVALNPNYIMAYYFLGNVYTDRWGPGDVDRAMQEYQRVWAIAPNYVQTHHQAGLVYLKKGQDERSQGLVDQAEADWNQALYYFQKYHDIDPVFEPNYTRTGWVHLQLADIEKMRGHPAEVQKHQEAAEKAYLESLYAWKCRIPENDLYEHWNATHRHFSGEMFENLGNVRFLRGKLPEAARAYKMSLWQDPNNVRVMKNLASVFSRMGRQEDVTLLWNRIRRLAPQDPDVQRVFHGNSPSHP